MSKTKFKTILFVHNSTINNQDQYGIEREIITGKERQNMKRRRYLDVRKLMCTLDNENQEYNQIYRYMKDIVRKWVGGEEIRVGTNQ